MDIQLELYDNLEPEFPARLAYTRRAFDFLPDLDQSRILDIGCGSGKPLVEIAQRWNGRLYGIDIDLNALKALWQRVVDIGYADRIFLIAATLNALPFGDDFFDLVWSEGSIQFIGFERGLQSWRRLLTSGGYLVLHQDVWLQPDPPQGAVDYWGEMNPGIRTVGGYLAGICENGYKTLAHFILPNDVWWHDYFGPLEQRVSRLRAKYEADPQVLDVLAKAARLVDMYQRYADWYGSAFFVMQKVQ